MGYPALRRWNHQLSFRAGINSAGSTSRTIATLAMISRCGQKEEWLRPLAAGQIHSCFMMTEPAPGAGSDPSMLRTTARRDGADFIIDGTKWLITGVVGAELCDHHGEERQRCAGAAWRHDVRVADEGAGDSHRTVARHLGPVHGRQSRCRPAGRAAGPRECGAGASRRGFSLGAGTAPPARLTHGMRWLGAARRAHDIAAD